VTDNIFQAAYDQLRAINTKDRSRVMADERDMIETRKATLSLDIANTRADIKSLIAVRDEMNRAIGTKETLLSESLATFESLTKVAADLDVQIKRMET
jgi:hypothetical protein